jgi:hypothetical protein
MGGNRVTATKREYGTARADELVGHAAMNLFGFLYFASAFCYIWEDKRQAYDILEVLSSWPFPKRNYSSALSASRLS